MNKHDKDRFISYEANEWEKEAKARYLVEERELILHEADDEQIRHVLASIKSLR